MAKIIIQIKLIERKDLEGLEDAVNRFLQDLEEQNFVNIKYQCTPPITGSDTSYSALILYKTKKS